MKVHRPTKAHALAKPLLALALAASTQALAQGSQTLEEIIVTAEHREASLQETEISLSAFNTEAIKDLGISNGLDLGGFVPNVNAQPYVGGRTGMNFTIRGIGNSETLITFDPAVSVYLDGILIAKNVGSLLDVLDLERVEVLRGPQGTLYGRNTMGGAINYVTRKPSNEFEGYVRGTLGNYGRADLRGMVNIPLLGADSPVGELNLKLNGGWLNRDGIQDNNFRSPPQNVPSATGRKAQGEFGTVDREVYSVQLQWRPTDSFSALYMYDHTDIDEVPETVWATRTNPDTYFGGVLAPYREDDESNRPDDIQAEHIQIADTTVKGHALTLDWQLSDNLTLQSLTGYREMDNYGEADSDGTPIPVLITRDVQEYDSLSQELRLLGNLFDARLDYSLGLFYMDEKGDLYNETFAGSPDYDAANIADYENKAKAVYGQGTYAFSDALKLTLGARYTKEDREMEKTLLPVSITDPIMFLGAVRNDPALAGSIYPKAQDDFDNATWLVSLGYNWNEDVLTYAKISTGYQSGGFNARDIRPEDFVVGFKEEKLLSYELGMKSTFNGRYQLNAAVFFSDYSDKRVNQFDPVNLVSIQRNAGKVEIYGAELEFLAQLSDHWRAGINYGYTHKEYKEYLVPSPGDPNVEIDIGDQANFPYSPDNTSSAFLSYEYPMDFGVFKARVDWSYRDKMTFLTPQPERNSSDSLQLWNARVSLDDIDGFGDTKMRVSLWGKNLTDEGYYSFGVNIYDTFGFDINTYGEPRTYGLDLELMF